MATMRLALVGCGNIGADLCIALQKGTIPAVIAGLVDVDSARAQALKSTFQLDAPIGSLESFAGQIDFIAECAHAEAVPGVVKAAIAQRVGCLIMSVGGLVAAPELLEEARAHGVAVRIPSGALCGLDGVRSAVEGGVHSVTLTTRKPPKGLVGAPYLEAHGIDVLALTSAQVVFEGTAAEAIRAFPKNVNVAAALSLAGIGPELTQVRVIADPNATENSHEIVVEGAFGRLQTLTVNLPSPRNAKSSYLASLSACAEVRAAAAAFASA